MTKKFSQARRDTFLSALRATGNQTLAAERAKVSRAWVQAQRSADPAFKLAVAEAVALVKVRLVALAGDGASTPGTIKPPVGWGFLAGAELVIKGTGGSALGPVLCGTAGADRAGAGAAVDGAGGGAVSDCADRVLQREGGQRRGGGFARLGL